MEEAPENGKESSHSAHANGMNESRLALRPLAFSAVGTAFFLEVKAARAWC
jgi:hypothetical protein